MVLVIPCSTLYPLKGFLLLLVANHPGKTLQNKNQLEQLLFVYFLITVMLMQHQCFVCNSKAPQQRAWREDTFQVILAGYMMFLDKQDLLSWSSRFIVKQYIQYIQYIIYIYIIVSSMKFQQFFNRLIMKRLHDILVLIYGIYLSITLLLEHTPSLIF